MEGIISDRVLCSFIDKLVNSKPSKISGSHYWNVVLNPSIVSGWENIVREMIMKNDILYRLGLRCENEEKGSGAKALSINKTLLRR